ncbi:MAG TPA: lysophospholipid acyltransferase family protein [Candidatus Ozemobacteraceae bacterium]|nr:lysophospholipid acyltransferase family protein [Candidatus Ozemobacteraceae bacterium]
MPTDLTHESDLEARWDEPGYAQKARIKGRCAGLFVKLWASSLRVEHIGADRAPLLHAAGRRVLFVVWHGSQLVPLATYRNRGISIMTSLSRDGDIQDSCMKTLGFTTVRGSSSRGGARALLAMVRSLEKTGLAAIAVDGPRGPYHQAKPGAVVLAQKTGAIVLPVGAAHTRCRHLRSWDKFELPLPFSRSVVWTGEPFEMPARCSPEEGCRLIEEHLQRCEDQARERIAA